MTRSNAQYGNDPVHDLTPEPFDEPQDMPETANLPATVSEPEAEPEQLKEPSKPVKPEVKKTLAGGTWVALIVGALLLIALLVFILQNQQQVELNLLSWTFQFPAGIGYLFSAITGALIMALVGGVRMLELRRQVRKQRRS